MKYKAFKKYTSRFQELSILSVHQWHCLVLHCQGKSHPEAGLLETQAFYLQKMNYLTYNHWPEHDINLRFPSPLITIIIR